MIKRANAEDAEILAALAIQMWTGHNLAVPKNYESVGFQLYDRKPNESESAFTGDYLYYEIIL